MLPASMIEPNCGTYMRRREPNIAKANLPAGDN